MATQPTYNLGQVVYVALKKENVVMPALILKKTVEQTLQGEQVSYTVQMGKDKKVMALDIVAGDVFATSQETKDALIGRATKGIEYLVSNAVAKAKEWYGVSEPRKKKQKTTQTQEVVQPVQKMSVVDEFKAELVQEAEEGHTQSTNIVAENDEYDIIELSPGQFAKMKRVIQT
jgi:hypothetical protein